MKKIVINMLSSADKVDGQGVGSAYLEQVNLVKESKYFKVLVNSKEQANIIHCHTIDPINYYRMKKNKKGVNVSYVHFLPTTLDGSIKLPKFAFNIFKKYVIKFYNSADHLVVVNPIFINDLEKAGISREKITYIPNYVSKEKFYKYTKKQKSNIRKKYDINENDFVVLGAGQVQTRKGVKDFVNCAKKLPKIKFVWCGGFSFGKITDGYDELKEIMENPPKNVKFLGIIPREEMNDIYNMADVLFVPSYNELFPMTILEAINSETPLLLRNLELYEDILFNDYLKGKNNKEFVQILKELSTDEKLYKKYSKKSKMISEFYSKEHVLEMWEEFYKEIAKETK
ncbi:MAG: glycosyltransferase family 4 protein [Firmicutes bacterium]|nr:glycosyltransferase family 4 protein [Bacillota bacterium]